jgi:Zn-finger nucleic acid-binding protein
MCGAATSSGAPLCQYCGSQLATVSCPVCFGMMFLGSKHCPRCGAATARQESVAGSGRKCPRCLVEMQAVVIGQATVLECGSCFGLWVDTTSFEAICADREQQAAVLGTASHEPPSTIGAGSTIKYVPCPECSLLMNRVNFARCSGVIIDLCKKHGIWFDCDELSRIVEYIRGGGLELSRSKEKAELEEERRKLRQEQMTADIHHSQGSGIGDSEATRISGIASARGLLKFLLD